jgi:predicted O-methyltransferase YrrM
MHRRAALLGLIAVAVLVVVVAFGQGRRARGEANATLPAATTEAEKKILAVIDQMRAQNKTYLSVPVTDGRMLRLLTEAAGAKTVAEIGTSTGYSGLWFSLALHRTGGRLITFEMDAGRAEMARKHFEEAGVGKLATIIQGDAHENVRQLKAPLDVVFIDADKEGYVDYLNKVLPLVRPGGLLLAHNVGMSGVDAYLKEVQGNPALETVLYMEGGGLAITVKKH